MKLLDYLHQRVYKEKPEICLPPNDEWYTVSYEFVLLKLRSLVDQLDPDFDPDDRLPSVLNPVDTDEVAAYNLHMLVMEWKRKYKRRKKK